MPRVSKERAAVADSLKSRLLQLQWVRNAFYAFESALNVHPMSRGNEEIQVAEWNATTLWRSSFGWLGDHALFFAEDVLGGQFFFLGRGRRSL
jgi:hypothetical protein